MHGPGAPKASGMMVCVQTTGHYALLSKKIQKSPNYAIKDRLVSK